MINSKYFRNKLSGLTTIFKQLAKGEIRDISREEITDLLREVKLEVSQGVIDKITGKEDLERLGKGSRDFYGTQRGAACILATNTGVVDEVNDVTGRGWTPDNPEISTDRCYVGFDSVVFKKLYVGFSHDVTERPTAEEPRGQLKDDGGIPMPSHVYLALYHQNGQNPLLFTIERGDLNSKFRAFVPVYAKSGLQLAPHSFPRILHFGINASDTQVNRLEEKLDGIVTTNFQNSPNPELSYARFGGGFLEVPYKVVQ